MKIGQDFFGYILLEKIHESRSARRNVLFLTALHVDPLAD